MAKIVFKNPEKIFLPGVVDEKFRQYSNYPAPLTPIRNLTSRGLHKNNNLKYWYRKFGPRPNPRYAYQFPSFIYLNRMHNYAKKNNKKN